MKIPTHNTDNMYKMVTSLIAGIFLLIIALTFVANATPGFKLDNFW